jgi:hypothetical protein
MLVTTQPGQTPRRWHLSRDGKQYGPYNDQELQQMAAEGGLQGSDSVWREGMGAWIPVPDIFPSVTAAEIPQALPDYTPAIVRKSKPAAANSAAGVIGGLLALTVIGAIGFWATRGGPSPPSAPSVPAIPISATALYRAYEANEVGADQLYKRRRVSVSGRISSIGRDLLDEAYVVIGTEGSLFGVQCSFAKGNEHGLGTLRRGESISIEGMCNGKMIHVLVKDCRIVN